ncbi:MAG: 4-(cytidine 5'-diphospho)-2-C-methyl-D-erythritol kinase [Candidatus Omnitrophica bacterium]|nr:4-(cytidine 5'-diphospho)-2-C-methyl-D-erythritol kinase [Candidatus Omnitrophota bacterium]
MKSLTLQAPAKINVFLKVKNKRKDGFHNIKTIFQRINLSDTLEFTLTKTGRIRLTSTLPTLPLGSKNLVYQAAEQLRLMYGVKNGIDIHIDKKIPVAAGLAGGSTNAATTLIGLNKIWQLGISKHTMIEHARRLGSDVPFFLEHCSWAMGTARGDQIEPLDIGSRFWHILVVPRKKITSGQVYQGLNLQLTKSVDNANILIQHLKNKDLRNIGRYILNDLESAIVQIAPSLQRLKERIKLLSGSGVMISGSGPAVFGLAKNQKDAEQFKSVLSRYYKRVYAIKTL